MHLALTLLIAWVAAALIGAVSAVVMFGLAWLLQRRFSFRPEFALAIGNLVGLCSGFVGHVVHSRVLVGVAVLCCGWLFLLVVLIPTVVVRGLVTRVRRPVAA